MSLSLYVHVPFCSSRCGYCDFNTYTAEELGNEVRRDSFHDVLRAEIRWAARDVEDHESIVETIFFGGGTPTLIGASALNAVLDEIRGSFNVAPHAEITTEANPDSVDAPMLEELRAGGFNRISFGMQSSAPHVLQVLDRTHSTGSVTDAVGWAKGAGFAHINVDLIYGTPGESDDDVLQAVDDVLAMGVDHVSAYALIVEDGTALARRIARGDIPPPDDDVAADRYLLIDDALSRAGMPWYEISNWATPGAECRHNLAYWQNRTWIGIGPGAHSHRAGVRWWNHKHPATYAERLSAGESPAAEREELSASQREIERIMLGIRMRSGIPISDLDDVSQLQRDGLLEVVGDRVRLTRRGRLLANRVIEALT